MSISFPVLAIMGIVSLSYSNFVDASSRAESPLPDTIKFRNLDTKQIRNPIDQTSNQYFQQRIFSKNQQINRSVTVKNNDNSPREDMTIMPEVRIEVTNDKQLNNYDVHKESKNIEWLIDKNAFIRLGKKSELIINNTSRLVLKNKAVIEVSDSATLYILNGSTFELDSGAVLIIREGARLIAEKNATLIIHPYSTIILQRANSTISIYENSRIVTASGYNIVTEGDGSIYIDEVLYTNQIKR